MKYLIMDINFPFFNIFIHKFFVLFYFFTLINGIQVLEFDSYVFYFPKSLTVSLGPVSCDDLGLFSGSITELYVSGL